MSNGSAGITLSIRATSVLHAVPGSSLAAQCAVLSCAHIGCSLAMKPDCYVLKPSEQKAEGM